MREILCFGDSNTYGLIPGTKERYKENIRWTGILQQKLKEKDCRIVEEKMSVLSRKDSAEERRFLRMNFAKIERAVIYYLFY